MESTTLNPNLVMPVLFGALIAFGVYRRVRRNIGRQTLSPARLTRRIAMFAIVGVMVLLMSYRDMNLFTAMLAGIAGGAALGWFGLKHTQFEATAQGQFYTPHTYIGAFVSALFLGRIAYRFIVLYSTSHALAAADPSPFAAYQKSPLTLAIFGALVGYYVFYYAGVLRRGQGLQPPPGDSSLQA